MTTKVKELICLAPLLNSTCKGHVLRACREVKNHGLAGLPSLDIKIAYIFYFIGKLS